MRMPINPDILTMLGRRPVTSASSAGLAGKMAARRPQMMGMGGEEDDMGENEDEMSQEDYLEDYSEGENPYNEEEGMNPAMFAAQPQMMPPQMMVPPQQQSMMIPEQQMMLTQPVIPASTPQQYTAESVNQLARMIVDQANPGRLY